MTDEPSTTEPILFRPSKQRKAYRARLNTAATNNNDDDNDNGENDSEQRTQSEYRTTSQTGDDVEVESEESTTAAAAAALRMRHLRRKLHGVSFSSSSRNTNLSLDTAEHPDETEAKRVVGIADRFTHQTGLVKYLGDRHLNEFITARLSINRTVAPASSSSSLSPDDFPSNNNNNINNNNNNNNNNNYDNNHTSTIVTTTTGNNPTVQVPQGAKHGKLEEVAIPTLTTNPQAQNQIAPLLPPQKKVRLGPDGKPWRGRKRRGSDDAKRDQLVEEFLRENRLDVYDVPETDANTSEADGAADERMAQEFRQQYLDDVARRRRQHKKKKKPQAAGATATTTTTAKVGLRGPKLGGSRNARAHVREMLLKEKKAQGK